MTTVTSPDPLSVGVCDVIIDACGQHTHTICGSEGEEEDNGALVSVANKSQEEGENADELGVCVSRDCWYTFLRAFLHTYTGTWLT